MRFEKVYINREDLFLCYSPVLYKFLNEIKGFNEIDKRNNIETNKKCWIFIKSIKFENALLEWRMRKINNEYFYSVNKQ